MRSSWVSLTFLIGLAAPVCGDVVRSSGTAEAYVRVIEEGEDCETGAAAACKIGEPCFAQVIIQGEAATALYQAMRGHKPKHDEVSGVVYLGTMNDAMSCYGPGPDDGYQCYIGYDAVSNSLSRPKACQDE